MPAATTTVQRVLRRNGIGKLPRRSPGEREAALRPAPAPAADVREIDLSPRRLRTEFGGLSCSSPTSFGSTSTGSIGWYALLFLRPRL